MVLLRVYKIVNDVDEYVYIGSTTKDLATRLEQHITNAETGKEGKLYDHMRRIGINHFIMQLLKNVEMKSRYEFEQYEIEKQDPNLLLNSRCENNSEYWTKNKDKINIRCRELRHMKKLSIHIEINKEE